MDEVDVHVEVEINHTEDSEKVRKAVENILGSLEFEVKSQGVGSLLIAKGKGIEELTKFYNMLRIERIRDAARGVLFDGLEGKSIVFYLNKQVAYAGHVSFSKPTGESPLGPIKVKIHFDNPRELIEWLAPRTA